MARRSKRARNLLIFLLPVILLAGVGVLAYVLARENGGDQGRGRGGNGESRVKGALTKKSRGWNSPPVDDGCISNMKQVCLVIGYYRDDHGGVFPRKISDVYPEYIIEPDCFLCPGKELHIDKNRPDEEVRKVIEEAGPYKMVSGMKPDSPEHWILCYCDSGHHDGKIIICTLGTEAYVVTESQFEELKQRQLQEMSQAR